MHIHKPKTVGGLKDFLAEIFVIVVGILIALGLDEAVRAAHDHVAAQDAREAVYAEIRQNLSYMKARTATQDCVEHRLDEIGMLLAKAGDGPLSTQPQWIGQPAVFYMANQRWQVATGSGSAGLFSPDEQSRIGPVYVMLQTFNEAVNKEQDAWAQLRGLESWSGALGAVGRVHFISALQQARLDLWETRITARLAFQRAESLGIGGIDADTLNPGHGLPHAVCLPIDTPRAKALQLLNGAIWSQPK